MMSRGKRAVIDVTLSLMLMQVLYIGDAGTECG